MPLPPPIHLFLKWSPPKIQMCVGHVCWKEELAGEQISPLLAARSLDLLFQASGRL